MSPGQGAGGIAAGLAAAGLCAVLTLWLWLGQGGAPTPPPAAAGVDVAPAAPAADPEALREPLSAAPRDAAAPERVEVVAKSEPGFRRPAAKRQPTREAPAPEAVLVDLSASLLLRLVDVRGQPLAHRSVQLRTWGGYHAAERTLVADGDGWVELEFGHLSSRPRHAEFSVQPKGGRAALRSDVLQLGPDSAYGLLLGRVRGGDVVLQEPPLLAAGRVVDARGEAVAGAVLELVPKGSRDRPLAPAPLEGSGSTSDNDGRFVLYGTPGAGAWQLVAAAPGRASILPVPVTPGQTDVEVRLLELASAKVELVLAPWMAPSDFRVTFEAPGLPPLPLLRALAAKGSARYVADQLPRVDGHLVVRWADFDEECLRVAAPLENALEVGGVLEPPPVEMEQWVQSAEITVRGANDPHLRGARAQLRGAGGRGRSYDVGSKPVRVPRLRGPMSVRVEAAGYVSVDLHGVGERLDVVLQLGSRVVFRPPLSGAHGHRKLVWYVEPLDSDSLRCGTASCAKRADEDVVFYVEAPGSYRVRARAHKDVEFPWDGELHVPLAPGDTPLWLQDPEGDWNEFLEGVAERYPDG